MDDGEVVPGGAPGSDGNGTGPTGPLDGVRVLDLSSVVMGPLATQTLGDLGADVISIEGRDGDTNRAMGPGPAPGLSGVAMNLLRNKRSVGLDLKQAAGRDAVLALAATCDVVVTNLRPGPLARLGLTYHEVRAVRPDVVFCRAQGYPGDSDQADAPAYDDIIQSASGVGDLFARQGHEPALLPTLVADKVSGLTIASAVLAALYHRAVSGEGQEVEVPMIDVMRSFVLVEHGSAAIAEPPVGPSGYQRILTPERRPQATSDGWINVLPYAAEHYVDLFTVGGRPELADDERFATRESRIANSGSLYREVARLLRHRTTEEWMEFCRDHAIPATRAATLDELVDALPVVEHPEVGPYRQIPPPIRFGATPASVRRHASRLGQDGPDVLTEIGYTDDQIDRLRESGVLYAATDAGTVT
ncbi:MAG: CaiB/BaiF CoA transferase family protein [Acidimicrobiales bacterium]